MKAESKNTHEDLPNQEKNQYWTDYWWETGAFIQKWEKDQIKKITDLFEDDRTETGREKKIWTGEQGSLFWMTYITWKERQTYGSLFEKTLNLQ